MKNRQDEPQDADTPKSMKTPATVSRRSFIARAALGAGAIAFGQPGLPASYGGLNLSPTAQSYSSPNILLILVDQWRYPVPVSPFTAIDMYDHYLPNVAKFRQQSVNFTNYFPAATACSPSRGTLLTGLYSHQTAVLNTQISDRVPNLNPGFPTWGTLLRQQNYETYWYGKWHLSNKDADSDDVNSLEQYGFAGGTFPSPNGSPGQGLQDDPNILEQFEQWLAQQRATPWCTAISLINPHDIWCYPKGTQPFYPNPPQVFTGLPQNFETPQQLARKPELQTVFRDTQMLKTGATPFSGPRFPEDFLNLLNTYLVCQQTVDALIGDVLSTLADSPFSNNTIVIFTSDHGEYGGAHGLHDKSSAIYEETIHVPFYVRDLGNRGALSERPQLFSSVDFPGFLLTLATGNNNWRAQYPWLAGRAQFGEALWDPSVPGRPYILHTTDEPWASEVDTPPYDGFVPQHVIGYRTVNAKLGLYSFWEEGTIDIEPARYQLEYYDYSTSGGRLETDSTPISSAAMNAYNVLVGQIIPSELRQPLPTGLQSVQQQAIQDYTNYITHLREFTS